MWTTGLLPAAPSSRHNAPKSPYGVMQQAKLLLVLLLCSFRYSVSMCTSKQSRRLFAALPHQPIQFAIRSSLPLRHEASFCRLYPSPLFIGILTSPSIFNSIVRGSGVKYDLCFSSSKLRAYGGSPFYSLENEQLRMHVESLVNELDPDFKKALLTGNSTAVVSPAVESNPWIINKEVLNRLRQARTLRQSQIHSSAFFKTQAYQQAEDALAKYADVVPFVSTAVVLVLFREEGIKYAGEERYYVKHGHYKSSVLNTVEQSILFARHWGSSSDWRIETAGHHNFSDR